MNSIVINIGRPSDGYDNQAEFEAFHGTMWKQIARMLISVLITLDRTAAAATSR